MTKEYISREVALAFPFANGQYDRENADPHFINGCESYREWLETIPTADVVERKLGVWVWDDEGYHCSECFFHAYGCTEEILSGDYHFCPHCGASMQDGGHDA